MLSPDPVVAGPPSARAQPLSQGPSRPQPGETSASAAGFADLVDPAGGEACGPAAPGGEVAAARPCLAGFTLAGEAAPEATGETAADTAATVAAAPEPAAPPPSTPLPPPQPSALAAPRAADPEVGAGEDAAAPAAPDRAAGGGGTVGAAAGLVAGRPAQPAAAPPAAAEAADAGADMIEPVAEAEAEASVARAQGAEARAAPPPGTPAQGGAPASPPMPALAAAPPPDWRLEAVAARSAHPAAAPRAHPAAPAPRDVAAQITLGIVAAADPRVEIRLDPPELGRVEIRLTGVDGALQAVVLAERPETQEFLRRNAEELVRDLVEAGYGRVSLEFAAGGEAPDREAAPGARVAAPGEGAGAVLATPEPARAPAPARGWSATGGDARLDIRL